MPLQSIQSLQKIRVIYASQVSNTDLKVEVVSLSTMSNLLHNIT